MRWCVRACVCFAASSSLRNPPLPALNLYAAQVHLAGESAGSGPMGIPRWTAAQKERILESRRQGTRTLVDALGKMERKPEVLVSASGVGYYGTQCGEADVTEQSARGSGFLADVRAPSRRMPWPCP